MKETDFNEAQESKEENIDVKELLFKYLIHWPMYLFWYQYHAVWLL